MPREQAHSLLAAISQAITGAVVLTLAVQQQVMGGALLFCLYYLMSALHGSFVLSLFHHDVPAAQRSSLQSVLSLAGHLGGVVGGLMFGYVAQQHTIAVAWWWAGIILLVSTGLFVLMLKHTRADIVLVPEG
jgi:predicted MFS family arabinose efflux permease